MFDCPLHRLDMITTVDCVLQVKTPFGFHCPRTCLLSIYLLRIFRPCRSPAILAAPARRNRRRPDQERFPSTLSSNSFGGSASIHSSTMKTLRGPGLEALGSDVTSSDRQA